jgi:hypothetical protein
MLRLPYAEILDWSEPRTLEYSFWIPSSLRILFRQTYSQYFTIARILLTGLNSEPRTV